MRLPTAHILVLSVFSFLLLPSLVLAEVRVELRNGRTIIADSCEDAGASMACSKMGGTFDIEKKDIVKIENISGGGRDYDVAPEGPDTAQQAEQGQKERGKEDEDKLKGALAVEGVSGSAGRLEEIRKRKAEIAPEREKLMEEREKLQEDLKKAPDWMPVKQYEELQKRNADLDEKIKKYNEEVGRLNREEKSITDESKPTKD